MGAQLVGPDDTGEGFGQEGSDFAAKYLDGAEIGGKAMGEDPARRKALLPEPRWGVLPDARAHARATGGPVMPIIGA